MKNNKGFVMTETLVVTVFLVTILSCAPIIIPFFFCNITLKAEM